MTKQDPEAKLDGGWGWVVVVAGLIVYLIVFGSLRCQSVLFVYIVEEFQADFSDVAWVSSIATGGFSFAGVLAAPLISKLGHRWTVILGGSIAALGSLLASFAPTLLVLDLTAGILTGIGMGIAFVPTPVIIGHYFTKRRSLAINIASVGASVGTLAVCPLNQVITDAYTIRGYFLAFSAVFLNICVAGALMRPPPKAPGAEVADKEEVQTLLERTDAVDEIQKNTEFEKSAPENDKQRTSDDDNEIPKKYEEDEIELSQLIDKVEDKEAEVNEEKPDKNKKNEDTCWAKFINSPLLRNRSYIIYCVSQVVFLAGFLCNQLYIVPYAVIEVGLPKIEASLLMSIGAFIEIGSRLMFGFLGDLEKINRIWLFSGVLFIMSVFATILPFMKTFASLATITALTGLFQGGFSGMSVVILADIVGLKLYAPALGISTLLNGFGTLLTPPAVGLAVDATGKPSTALFISAGILFLGAILSGLIKISMNFEERDKKSHEKGAQKSTDQEKKHEMSEMKELTEINTNDGQVQ
ncbi:monocarboxylate transporter 2-like [Styela clava]